MKEYYTHRHSKIKYSIEELFQITCEIFEYFNEKYYFLEFLTDQQKTITREAKLDAKLKLGFMAFPLNNRYWEIPHKLRDQTFAFIEYLFDNISKPGPWEDMTTETGWHFTAPSYFDQELAQREFSERVNNVLKHFEEGYKVSEEGYILKNETDGLELIYSSDIIPFDYENVDSKVVEALSLWRNKNSTILDKKNAVRLLSDVFEFLSKSGKIKQALDSKDSSDLFNIANNFGIRHHNPKQKTNYDEKIWYSWMFHFYLATYHAVIRTINITK